MPAVKKYTRINFQNYPSTSTPLNATNLNKLDKGIDDLDDEVVTVKNAIENMSFDADAISYDNTQSGLQATDVQGAVDEINDNLAQTPITVEGQTLSTIDEKLNFLCEKQQYLGEASIIYNEQVVSHTYTITQGDVDYYKALIFANSRVHSSVDTVPTITGADYTFDVGYNSHDGFKIGIVTDLEVGKTITMSYSGNPGQLYRCSVIGIN